MITNSSTTATPVDQLFLNSLWVQSIHRSWSEDDRGDESDGDGEWSYHQAMDYEDVDNARMWRLIVCNGSVVAVWVPEHDRSYARHEYAEYLERIGPDAVRWDETPIEVIEGTEDEDASALRVLNEREWERLFDADTRSAQGPIISYWYPCPSVEDDPIKSAAIISESMCVVAVEGVWGLAAKGVGQDITWEIVESYVAVGELPPVAYARDLRRIGSRGQSDADKRLVAACRRALMIGAQQLHTAENQLRIDAADWAAGR